MLDYTKPKSNKPRFNGFYVLFVWLGTLLLGPFAMEIVLVLFEGGAQGLINDVLEFYYFMLLFGFIASLPALVLAYLVYFFLVYTKQRWRRIKFTVAAFALAGLALTTYLFLNLDFIPVFISYGLVLTAFATFVPIKRST